MDFPISQSEHETPLEIGDVLADWVVRKDSYKILDPAMGSGGLLRCVLSKYDALGIRRGRSRIFGIEVNPSRVRAANKALGAEHATGRHLIVGDFLLDGFSLGGPNGFDGIVCNPPFLRWQEIPPAYRGLLTGDGKAGQGVTSFGLAGLHVFFLRKAFEYARPGGRLAFILPSTTFASSYATPIKHFLKREATIVALLAFDPKLELFPGVMTNVSLLFFEKRSPPKSHRPLFGRLEYIPTTKSFHQALRGSVGDSIVPAVWPLQARLDPAANWANLVIRQPRRRSTLVSLGSIAEVRRGIATGCNAFFTLSRQAVQDLRLPQESVRRFVPRLRLVGYDVSPQDIEHMESTGEKTFLLCIRPEQGTDPATTAYIDFGLATGVHEGYLTSHRAKWYCLEGQPPPPVLFTYMTRSRPRFLQNASGASYLNNLIGIYPKERISRERLKAFLAILNSDTVLSPLAKLGRRYAGGLLKVEPGDLSKLPVMDPRRLSKRQVERLAGSFQRLTLLARTGLAAKGISDINEAVDGISRRARLRSRTP